PRSQSASPASWTRAMSSSSSPTTAGSTSPAASTRSPSTRSRTSSRPSGGRPRLARGGAAMRISRSLLDEVVGHALEDPGNEVCGLVAVTCGEQPSATGVLRARNIHESPMKFEIDPGELLALYNRIEDEGGALGAIYHSHVRSPPYPSQTDVNFARSWPGVEWVIVGLSAGSEPEVRSYLIEDGRIEEVPVGEPGG